MWVTKKREIQDNTKITFQILVVIVAIYQDKENLEKMNEKLRNWLYTCYYFS